MRFDREELEAGVDPVQVQTRMRCEHGIEVGGGLGPDAPSIWRIGLMGPNATEKTAEIVLGALAASALLAVA